MDSPIIQYFSAKLGQSKGKKSNLLVPSTEQPPSGTPGRVTFLEELNDMFIAAFPELWKLGQAYFSGELFVRGDPSKKEEFKVLLLFQF